MKKTRVYGAFATLVVLGVSVQLIIHGLPTATARASIDLPSVDTTPGLIAAAWTDNVTISIDSETNSFRYQSNGLPAYGMAENYLVPNDPTTMPFSDDPPESFWTLSASDIEETPVDETITTLPKYSENTTDTTLGQIGVAINGARIFNDYEDTERTIVALNDNVIHDHAAFVDECNGHPLGDGSNYHYHGVPVCISNLIDVAGEHSYMVGVLQDGFPIYSNQGEGGVLMTNADLDECGGHFGPTPEFPDGIYHYHLTADETPYSIDCYHGEVMVASRGDGRGDERGGPDLSDAAARLGISEDELRQALGNDGPPNFEAAAQALGISVDTLMDVMPAPPQ